MVRMLGSKVCVCERERERERERETEGEVERGKQTRGDRHLKSSPLADSIAVGLGFDSVSELSRAASWENETG